MLLPRKIKRDHQLHDCRCGSEVLPYDATPCFFGSATCLPYSRVATKVPSNRWCTKHFRLTPSAVIKTFSVAYGPRPQRFTKVQYPPTELGYIFPSAILVWDIAGKRTFASYSIFAFPATFGSIYCAKAPFVFFDAGFRTYLVPGYFPLEPRCIFAVWNKICVHSILLSQLSNFGKVLGFGRIEPAPWP